MLELERLLPAYLRVNMDRCKANLNTAASLRLVHLIVP
jgi:hypothetical protein